MTNKYAAESRAAQAKNKRFRACDRKKAYDTAEDAEFKGAKVYKCWYCDKYHRTQALTTLYNTLRNKRK